MYIPDVIDIQGAREHNLKNIDIQIPREQFVVITGVSGSGKSSLVFDTLYAEGQRRYIETFSAYARQFLGNPDRPDVEKIDGLSPVVAIGQKTSNRSPRSTVGTITEIYDFIRLLYSRASEAYSYNTQKKMIRYNEEQILKLIHHKYLNKRINILSPLVKTRKGHYRELFVQILKKGYVKARIDGEVKDIISGMKLDRYKNHDIEIIIDRLQIKQNIDNQRLKDSIQNALKHGNGTLLILDEDTKKVQHFSKNYICEDTGISYDLPDPNLFSFNSPKGMCSDCSGLGISHVIDLKKIIPDDAIPIKGGGLAPIKEITNNWINTQLQIIALKFDFDLNIPIKKIPKKAMEMILYGGKKEVISHFYKESGVTRKYKLDFDGIANFIINQYKTSESNSVKKWAKNYLRSEPCKTCQGSRLKKEASFFKIKEKNIAELTQMDLETLYQWFQELPAHLSEKQLLIGSEILKEINTRIRFLLDIGLEYLSLNRGANTLSGGESQRIRLATQIGTQLVGVLYVLDEPSIGLHQRDNQRLIKSLHLLKELGNSVIVVEHDKDMMLASDYIIDIGPKAGKNGGEVIFEGSPKQMLKANTLTSSFLNKKSKIEIPEKRRKPNKFIELKKCTGNNLKNINVKFPIGVLTVVTGVSGSGKSTLINETLYPILNEHFFNAVKKPLPYEHITGLNHIDKVIGIDQSPIGKTPRSNPATYTGVLSKIRNIFSQTTESQIRGYKPNRFSFNVVGGRCENCKGSGVKTIKMNFLPDVFVSCDICNGNRFNRETLEVLYKGKSISNVLDMTVNQAIKFFENIPSIYRILETIQSIGLGYITLGQQSTTLSGGEAQRIKLATELSKKDTGNTLYILDEPTTGLHFYDIKILMNAIQYLVSKNNTVLVIEHNMDVIKTADYIIDIGPDGGKNGGEIVAFGTPEEITRQGKGYTAHFLKEEL